MEVTERRLSVVIRPRDQLVHRTVPDEDLRRYVGEIYSTAWDCFTAAAGEASSQIDDSLLDVIVYPQSLPNAAPEQWLYHRSSLDCICGADEMLGWYSQSSSDAASDYKDTSGQGVGGLEAHCKAVNDDRSSRGLDPITGIKVDLPRGAMTNLDGTIQFLEDVAEQHDTSFSALDGNAASGTIDDEEDVSLGLLGGARLDNNLYDSVAVGGTFDGLHYGHRKLLTLAISSVEPNTGRLLIGVTSDEMLKHKKLAKYITPVKDRVKVVKDFISNLAPGIKNLVKIVVIDDAFGPTATEGHFKALVLSHETLDNGLALNEIRKKNGHDPLVLLCTRRTEANAMSSTALRFLRANKEVTSKVLTTEDFMDFNTLGKNINC
eukprot:CAMPEP_0116071648 /NCGR_PEP_ID=MMETSP0322-20121206/13923_1 /TAXON_ID=163516 /ORGANISM="Leptocylindrus danicus var. apora, Strain B651" /LENGTH=376 /DNA_ID=CAMNT_0003560073 /DNA_START=382 /DNA_END=1513 /DNA_ORIENTATION=+